MAATTAYNFDLLDLADGESGDAAVSVVVDKTKKKKKTAAEAAAKAADPARPASSAQGGKPKFSFCTLVPLDAGTTSTPPTRRRRIFASYILGYRSRIAYAPVWWVDFGLLVAILSVCVDLLVLFTAHRRPVSYMHGPSVCQSTTTVSYVRVACMHVLASWCPPISLRILS
jgi:hypothetical protein